MSSLRVASGKKGMKDEAQVIIAATKELMENPDLKKANNGQSF